MALFAEHFFEQTPRGKIVEKTDSQTLIDQIANNIEDIDSINSEGIMLAQTELFQMTRSKKYPKTVSLSSEDWQTFLATERGHQLAIFSVAGWWQTPENNPKETTGAHAMILEALADIYEDPDYIEYRNADDLYQLIEDSVKEFSDQKK